MCLLSDRFVPVLRPPPQGYWHEIFVQLVFALTFAVSVMMLLLVIYEIIGAYPPLRPT